MSRGKNCLAQYTHTLDFMGEICGAKYWHNKGDSCSRNGRDNGWRGALKIVF